MGLLPSLENPHSLLHLPLGIPLIVTVEPLAPHSHELHDHNTKQMIIDNYNYQFIAKSHKRLQKLAIGDDVLIRVHPEKFPPETLKKLYTRRRGPHKVLRRFGSSAYELDILCDLGISSVFSVENLTRYRTSTRPQQILVHPLQQLLLRRPTTKEFVQSFPIRIHLHAIIIRQWRIFRSWEELMGITSYYFFV